MQILHSPLSRPQPSTDSTHGSSPPLLQIRRDSSGSHSKLQTFFPISKQYLVTLCTALIPSQTKPPHSMDIYLPSYLRLNSSSTMISESELDARTPLVTAGDSRRNNPSGDGGRRPGDHYKDTGPPRLVPSEEDMETEDQAEDEDDSMYEVNGFKFRHSDRAHLILNLYSGEERNGYTFSAYLPETEDTEAMTFEESRLFSYMETYLLDCVNTETVPVRLIRKFEKRNGINLMYQQNSVLCELRDFRRFPSAPSPRNEPVVQQVLLKPNNQTLLSDLNRIIEKSCEERRNYKNIVAGLEAGLDDGDDGVPVKRRRIDIDENDIVQLVPHDPRDVLNLDQRLELEKRLVKETAGKLCLNPSKQVGLFANRIQFEKFKWNARELKQTVETWAAKKRKIEAVRKHDLNADIGEDEAVAAPGPVAPPIDAYDRELLENTCKSTKDFMSVLKFVQKAVKVHKLKRESPRQAIQLPPAIYVDYPELPQPTNPEEFAGLTVPAEPSSIRNVNSENSVRQTQEYIFETERRKRPHRTRLTIYQRNGIESFYGELEQEAYIDSGAPDPYGSVNLTNMNLNLGLRGPSPMKPFVSDSSNNLFPCSKCQFELGSSNSVELYVRQFTDIFTEDGRRPCKIVFQKQGQPGPHTIHTNSYKPLLNGNSNMHNNNNPHPPNNVIISHHGVPPPPHNSSNTIIVSVPALAPASPSPVPTSSQGTPPQNQPPVQIVHPQPRPQPIQIYSNGQGATMVSMAPVAVSTVTSITCMPTMTQTATAASVNLNLNLNSARILQQQQQRQQLTRPQIYNLNLGPQQQQGTVMTRPTGTLQPAPQLIQQQQGMRMKQQPTLATLLLTGLPNSNSKPITVAIQPQPHQNQGNLNQIHINNSLDHHQQPQHHQLTHAQVNSHHHHHLNASNSNPIMIMVSPATAQSLGNAQTITIPSGQAGHHHHAGSVSVNLNAINLDGLLSVSNSNNHSTNYVTSTANALGLGTSSSNASLNTLNILRLSNSTNTVTLQPQQLVRQNSGSVMSPPQGNLVSMHSGATGILINHHSAGNAGNSSMNSGSAGMGRLQHQELEEISVPDLNSLLNNGPTRVSSGNYTRSHSNGTSIDLNLNLNVNLSGTAPTTSRSTSTNGPSNEHYEVQNGRPNSRNGNVNVNCVDSIFNALSDAIGPDLGQRLDNSMSNTGIGLVTSSMSPSNGKSNASPAITLNDLLGSPPMIPSPALSVNHLGSSPSPQSPISPSIHVSSSSLAYGTPRLSALLAGSPSADSSNLLVDSSTVRGGSTPNYGNLLDRLMAQQPQAVNQRVGGSRLNPIATATPNVVLEHPMLAATLTQGSNPSLRQALTRPTAYRQIAPAPPPNLPPQQQQLINLLGLVGAAATGNSNPAQPGSQPLRINSTNTKPSAGASGSLGGR